MLPVFILKNSIMLLFLFFRFCPFRRLLFVDEGGGKVLWGLDCEGGGCVASEGVSGRGHGDLSRQLGEGGGRVVIEGMGSCGRGDLSWQLSEGGGCVVLVGVGGCGRGNLSRQLCEEGIPMV